jgi:hypothetical protein
MSSIGRQGICGSVKLSRFRAHPRWREIANPNAFTWKGLLAVRAVALSACAGVGEDCPPMGNLPLKVLVTDAETEEALCDANVTASASDRSAVLSATTQCAFVGGWGPGTYSIGAENDGYEPASVSGVVVRDPGGECARWDTVTATLTLGRTSQE